MKQAISKAFSSAGLRQSFLVIFGNGFSAGVSAIALIIFSRLLGPEQFGIFSVAFSLQIITMRLADAGINIAAQKLIAQTYHHDQQLARVYLAAATRLKLITSSVLVCAGVIFAPYISDHWLHIPDPNIVRLAFLLSLVLIIFEYIALILQTIQAFKHSVFMSISQAVLKLVLAGGFILTGAINATTTFVLYSLTPLIGVILGVKYLPRWVRLPAQPTHQSYQDIGKIGRFTAIAVIAAAISENIDVLLVKSYLTEFDTGLFAAGARIALLLSLVAYSLGMVLNPRVAQYRQPDNLLSYLKKSSLVILVALISIPFLIPFSGLLIQITAGSDYLAATTSVRYLISSGMVLIATTPLIALFYLIDKPQYFAISGVVQTVILIAADSVLIPAYGINGAGFARLIARLGVFMFSLLYAAIATQKYLHALKEGQSKSS